MSAILVALGVLIAIVAIHECAHALAALALGCPIESVCIGVPLEFSIPWQGKKYPFSPFSLGSFRIGGVQVRFSWLLIGGGVVIANAAFTHISLRKKILIFLSGPLANLGCGVLSAVLLLGATKGAVVSHELTRASVEAVVSLTQGTVPVTQLSSPIGVVEAMARVITLDLKQGTLLCWLVLHFSVGIFNLFPLPALDGGQVLMAVVASLGKLGEQLASISTKWCYYLLLAGIIILVAKDVALAFE